MKKLILLLIIFLNTVSWAQLPGNVLVLDGINNYVDCGNDASLNMSSALTLEAWVKTSTITNARVISKWGSNSGYEMALINNEVWFTINQTQKAAYTVASLVGQWAHLAMTYDGTNSAIYINGTLVDTGFNGQQNLVDTGLILKIGNISNTANSFFSGSIDEVRVWNRERSQAQIQSTMNATLSSQYYSTEDSGLVGYWQFEEVSGDTAYDLSVHMNHGIIHGGIITDLKTDNNSVEAPKNYSLSQNNPNPFNPSTKISFALPQSEIVTLNVYNALGQTIATLLNEPMLAGTHTFYFNAKNLPSGIYFYKIRAGKFQEVKRMVLLK